MNSYPHVEDYLEIIAGKKTLAGGSPVPNSFAWLGATFAPIINLARYDNGFLDSVTDSTLNGTALTDRQAELACKLILKYTRQLNQHGINTDPVKSPRYRIPLRVIDRTKSITLDTDSIVIRFSFDQKMIESLKGYSKDSQGRVYFDRENRVWRIALTEYNVNWVCAYAESADFTLDSRIRDFMNRIIDCEQTAFKIQLELIDGRLSISNASPSLVAYIEAHLGGFGEHNLLRLVDNSQILGYTLGDTVLARMDQLLTPRVSLLACNKEYDLNQDPESVERIVDYCRAVDRWPVVVFNPTPVDTLPEWSRYFAEDEVFHNRRNKKELEITSGTKVIYTNTAIRSLERIPLLVSHVGMLVGTDKQIMVNRSEKIFYSQMKLSS